MSTPTFSQPGSSQQGVVLIEAMIAILIFSIGVLGIVGMQANMVKNTSESKFRADASHIAQQRIGFMWTNAAMLPPDPTPAFSIPEPSLPNGTITVSRTGKLIVVTVNWQQPGEPIRKFVTNASIVGEGEVP